MKKNEKFNQICIDLLLTNLPLNTVSALRPENLKQEDFTISFQTLSRTKLNKSLRCVSHVIHYTRLMCTSLLNAKKSTVAFLSTRVFSQSESLWQLINQSYCLHCRAVVTILLYVQRDKRGVFILSKSWETTFCESKNIVSKMKIKIVQWQFSFPTLKILFQPIMKNSTAQSLSWFPTETLLNNFKRHN